MISNSFVLRVMTAALCYEKQLSIPMSRRSVFEGPESKPAPITLVRLLDIF